MSIMQAGIAWSQTLSAQRTKMGDGWSPRRRITTTRLRRLYVYYYQFYDLDDASRAEIKYYFS